VKPVTQKEVQNIWQHVMKKRAVATTVPQAEEHVWTEAASGRMNKECGQEIETEQHMEQNAWKQVQEKAKNIKRTRTEERQSHATSMKEGQNMSETLREQKTITGEFLKMMREKRLQELKVLRNQVELLEEDCETVSCLSNEEPQRLES
jgi:hypothetical protein